MDQSLQNTHVKLLARDLLCLTPNPSDASTFSLGRVSASRAETVGTVTSRDLTPKFLKFTVDDGTGCVTCVLWLNYLSSPYFNRREPSVVRLIARAAEAQAAEVRIGAVARVRGRIVSYRGTVQITASDIVIERDPNAEILHWLDCLWLARNCYHHKVIRRKET